MRLLYVIFLALLATGAHAQNKEQTLADVRQDLTILYIETVSYTHLTLPTIYSV